MARKRIYNPVTRRYYSIQVRTGKRRRGQIKGLWKPKRRKARKSLWEIIFG